MEGKRTFSLLFFMLLAWSNNVVCGCQPQVVYVPGPPGPPGETIVKHIYYNYTPTLAPEVSKQLKRSKCLRDNAALCEEFKEKCEECHQQCTTAAYEYCELEERDAARGKRSIPVGPPLTHTPKEPSIRQVLMRQRRFAVEFDSNHDGHLSDEEFQVVASLPPEDILLKAMDANDDGQIDAGELMQAVKNEGVEVPQWEVTFALKSVDTDHNGAVSRDEWKNFIARFDQISAGDEPCQLLRTLGKYLTFIYEQP